MVEYLLSILNSTELTSLIVSLLGILFIAFRKSLLECCANTFKWLITQVTEAFREWWDETKALLFSLAKETFRILLRRGLFIELERIKVKMDSLHNKLKNADSFADKYDDTFSNKGKEKAKKSVEKLVDVIYSFEGVYDRYQLLQGQEAPNYIRNSWCCWVFILKMLWVLKLNLLNPIRKISIAFSVAKLNHELVELENGDSYQPEGAVADESRQQHQSLPKPAEDYNLVGLQSNTEKLITMLKERNKRQCIVVTGEAGVGKTTLVEKVYLDSQVTSYFELRAFVTVSQTYHQNHILKAIFDQLNAYDDPRLNTIEDKIRNHLQTSKQRYLEGVEEFIQFAKKKNPIEIRCPCKKCSNRRVWGVDVVRDHLLKKGFVENYYDWYLHKCSDGAPICTELQQNTVQNPYAQMVYDAAASVFPDTHHHFLPHRDDVVANVPYSPVHNDEDPNPISRQFFEMLRAANLPLYPGCETHTQMSVIGRMSSLKTDFRIPERLYDELCQFIIELLPKDNRMTKSFYDKKKQISALGLPVEKIDCCVNGCMIYWGPTASMTQCGECGVSRWKSDNNPRKQFHYFPIGPRLQRLYASATTASHMRWHAEHRTEDGEMCHPSDSEAWLNFNATHPDFARETRNVRMGLCTDGFNPFGSSGQQYSCWPVILTPYNLPPFMCMKKQYMFLTVIVPGPNNPKHKIDLYLQPLIHELQLLWEDGIQTYDVSKRQNFILRAALMWTINDFPAYSMISGWSTSGLHACPYCMDDSKAFYLRHSRKVSWFDSHRRFLDSAHRFRRNRVLFSRGVVEKAVRPEIRTGNELLEELDRFGFLRVFEDDAAEYNADVSRHCVGWKKRCIFWDLPYWSTNMIRHNLDVMHIEKNFFDNIFNTIMCVPGKTKDHLKARQDLAELGIRSELHPVGSTIPKASYTLNREQMAVILEWLKTLRFPDGYVSNLARNINMAKHQVFGMKSHDCHVFMQRLIPVAFRELLLEKVWEALTEISLYFRSLTSPSISAADMWRLDEEIAVVLCKLETIFPPTFFDVMEHLPVHLAYEARIAGPVQYRWMYPFERYLRHLKLNVKNKAHVEASICNAYLNEEASYFVSHYFGPDVRCRVRDLPRNDDGFFNSVRPGVLSIFTHPIKFYGRGKAFMMDEADLKIAHTYVLRNCPEVNQFYDQFVHLITKYEPNLNAEQVDNVVEDQFALWFKQISRDGFLDGVDNADILKDLAEGPLQKARRYDVCYVNGYRFHTISHSAKKKSSENSGVCVKSDDNSPDEADFYGKLEDIVDLEYRALPNKRVALFKCQWFDQTTTGYGHGTRIHPRYKLVDVHIGRFYRKYDPFVLASQASQVYYLSYPSLRQNMKDWRAVCKVRSKQFEETAFQLEERSTDFVANEDVSDLQVAPLRDPAGELLHLDETDHDDRENEDTDDEDLVLSDDDEVDDDYVT